MTKEEVIHSVISHFGKNGLKHTIRVDTKTYQAYKKYCPYLSFQKLNAYKDRIYSVQLKNRIPTTHYITYYEQEIANLEERLQQYHDGLLALLSL